MKFVKLFENLKDRNSKKLHNIFSQIGSISIMMMLIISTLCFVFWTYMHFVSDKIENNTISRAANSANRNIQACYNKNLYKNYGLLAYDEQVAKDEMKETFFTQLQDDGYSYLPFSLSKEIKIEFESLHTLYEMDELLYQSIQQTLMYVPKEYIERSAGYKFILAKARRAKKEIERHKKILAGLKKLGKLNKKWGKALKKLDDMNDVFSVKISSKGNIKIKMDKLNHAIATTEEFISKMLVESKNLERELSEQKQHLQDIESELPDGFVNSSIDMLNASYNELFQDSFEVNINDAYDYSQNEVNLKKDELRKSFSIKYADELPESVDLYIDGLAKLYELKQSTKKFEDDIKSDYEDDVDEIKHEHNYREKNKLRKYLKNDIADELEEWTEQISINSNIGKEYIDLQMQKYADDIISKRERELTEDELTNMSEDEYNLTLSTVVVESEVFRNLSSHNMKDFSDEDMEFGIESMLKSAALSEYIMGTFRHRLSRKWKPDILDNSTFDIATIDTDGDWDFYDKLTRDSFFKDGEIEYILAGDKSEVNNRLYVSGRIYITREIFNLLHVYTCNKKKTAATSIAVAISWQPWLVPVIKHGILIGWASIESCADVPKLLNGEDVAVVKISDDDWVSDIHLENILDNVENTGASSATSMADNISGNKIAHNLNYQNYTFYLRLYLNEMSFQKRLKRVMDIIELNNKNEFEPQNLITSHKIMINTGGDIETFERTYK